MFVDVVELLFMESMMKFRKDDKEVPIPSPVDLSGYICIFNPRKFLNMLEEFSSASPDRG